MKYIIIKVTIKEVEVVPFIPINFFGLIISTPVPDIVKVHLLNILYLHAHY